MSEQVTETKVLEALKVVKDPDLKRDIVSLGFIQNIKLEGSAIRLDLVLTTPACPVRDELKSECVTELKKLVGVETVHVNVTANVSQRPGLNPSGRFWQRRNRVQFLYQTKNSSKPCR